MKNLPWGSYTMIEIPISKPQIDEDEKKAVADVLESGMIAQGPKVLEFEKEFTSVINSNHAVAVSSGTTAIHLALVANGIKPGDEVITSPFTFIATATPILFCGATPIFVDIDPKTFNIDPLKIEAAITFLETGGQRVVICALDNLPLALDGKAGTLLVP